MSKGAGGTIDATGGFVADATCDLTVGEELYREGRADEKSGPVRQTVAGAAPMLGSHIAPTSSSVKNVVGRGRGCNGD
jgi:hypothetical protein